MAYSYLLSHCNTIPYAYAYAYAFAHADTATYVNAATHAHAATHADTHADTATLDSLRLRQHRGGPLLRGEEQRFRRLLGLG